MNLRIIEYTGESALIALGYERDGFRWEVRDNQGKLIFHGEMKEDLVLEVPLDVEILAIDKEGALVETRLIIPAKIADIKQAAAGILPNARLGV